MMRSEGTYCICISAHLTNAAVNEPGVRIGWILDFGLVENTLVLCDDILHLDRDQCLSHTSSCSAAESDISFFSPRQQLENSFVMFHIELPLVNTRLQMRLLLIFVRV